MIEFHLQSALEKVFVTKNEFKSEYIAATALRGEEFSFQIAFKSTEIRLRECKVEVVSDLKKHISLFRVDNVPALNPINTDAQDDNYLTKEPGLIPDVLSPLAPADPIFAYPYAWCSLWVTVKIPKTARKGKHKIRLVFENTDFSYREEKVFTLTVISAVLPKQKTIVTQWFHCDGIAQYYNQKMFSPQNWKYIENFIKTATEHGINMILTPIFTPALDTKIGHERATCQLVGITKNTDNTYSFDYTLLDRWVRLCLKHGVEYFEMAHLFSQWGAACAPKIMATYEGNYQRIFGWDTASDSDEYLGFLDAFLPSLCDHLKQLGIDEKVYFHLSDEPHIEHLERFLRLKKHTSPLLEGFKTMDALSNIEFFKDGVVSTPVPALNHIDPFLESKVSNLWTYYCCSQSVDVSNRFLAMPSARNRVLGAQLYKFDIVGFLQWGYNFYNSRLSVHPVNPYLVTDCMGAFPAGDPFSVYPAADGTAIPSLRIKVFFYGLQDLRALSLLEEFEGKEAVIKLLEEYGIISFTDYPKTSEAILSLREEINRRIASHI